MKNDHFALTGVKAATQLVVVYSIDVIIYSRQTESKFPVMPGQNLETL